MQLKDVRRVPANELALPCAVGYAKSDILPCFIKEHPLGGTLSRKKSPHLMKNSSSLICDKP
jgi:hypothetical protein